MAEITVDGIYKSFGENQVLTNLSFSVTEGERVGIVGPNGCGKTTLLKIIAGEPADSGTVSLPRGCRCGVLEQLPDYPETVSVRQVLWQAFEHIEEMGRELAAMEERMSRGEDTDMARYGSLRTAFETAGGYETDMRYNMMTGGLGISAEMQERPFSSLSGGEKTRVSLARLMLSGTDLLLLDEPTNHLDLESIEWLEEYLRTFKGTVLTVSHDRYFLDKVTRRTLELYEGAAVSYPGNYTYYTERKQEEAERLEAAKKRQDKEIARLSFTVERMKGWGLGNKKVMKRAFAMQKRLERIERIKTIKQEHKMKNRFSTAGQSGEDVFMIEDLAVGYDKPLVEGFSASVLRGERIALLGPNGSGKTTLLTTVLRDMPPLAGKIYEGVGLKKGYLPQNVSFPNPERTLLDMMLYDAGLEPQEARDRLAAFDFRGEEVFKRASVLSGGEKVRLKLCIFMNSHINTLFLDEPTNHLDILSREWIEDAIDDFSETMVFVSHDRYFISRFATRIWDIRGGKIRDFVGTYEEYRETLAREAALAAAAPAQKPPQEKAAQKPRRGTREEEKALRALRREIAALEKRIGEIDAELELGGDDYERLAGLVEEKQRAEDELLPLYEREMELEG